MGKFYNSIADQHKTFIEQQHLFFVGTAPASIEGHINISPKGLECFKVLSDNRVAYMDLIGSGNETAAHILENGRITFMFCSFGSVPLILRLYGKAFTVLPIDENWALFAKDFNIYQSTRQIIVADIFKVQTSCGFGVPIYNFIDDRTIHFEWAAKKGSEELENYISEKNQHSIDGLPSKHALGKTNGSK